MWLKMSILRMFFPPERLSENHTLAARHPLVPGLRRCAGLAPTVDHAKRPAFKGRGSSVALTRRRLCFHNRLGWRAKETRLPLTPTRKSQDDTARPMARNSKQNGRGAPSQATKGRVTV